MLTRPAPVGARHDPPDRVDADRAWLNDVLDALLGDEMAECLVCGEAVEVEGDRVECSACGSAIEPGPRVDPGQLTLV